MQQRIIEEYRMPLALGVSILHIERVILRFESGLAFDAGALCYLIRNTSSTRRNRHTFAINSLSTIRVEQVRKLIKQISAEVEFSGNKSSTIETKFRGFKSFIDWCDINENTEVLSENDKAKIALNKYSESLIDKIGRNICTNNTAAALQNSTISVLRDYFREDKIAHGIRRIQINSKQTRNTLVPSELSQTSILAWSEALFNGLSQLALDNISYPYLIRLPISIKSFNEKIWVFPLERLTENIVDKKDMFSAWDFQLGRIHTIKELHAKRFCRDGELKNLRKLCVNSIENAKKELLANNNNAHSSIRVNHANLGMSAFFLLFLANTGMNLAQALDLDWSKEFELTNTNPNITRQGFRQIKSRAQNKVVFFEIGIAFLTKFRQFLKLRDYVLNGKDILKLFFYVNDKNELKNLDNQVLERYFKRLIRLDPLLPKVRARQWRAAKQDFAINNLSPSVAAVLMQHSYETALNNYSNGTESNHIKEMGVFLSQVGEIAVCVEASRSKERVNSLGLCTDFDKPIAIDKNSEFKPDCKSSEGCLFCDKYRIHSDEKDTRKLISCRHYIRACSVFCENEKGYQKIFVLILNKIDFFITELRMKNLEMVNRVEAEVDINGELDSYWTIKFQQLVDLRLI